MRETVHFVNTTLVSDPGLLRCIASAPSGDGQGVLLVFSPTGLIGVDEVPVHYANITFAPAVGRRFKVGRAYALTFTEEEE